MLRFLKHETQYKVSELSKFTNKNSGNKFTFDNFRMEATNFDSLFNLDGYLRPFEHEIRRR